MHTVVQHVRCTCGQWTAVIITHAHIYITINHNRADSDPMASLIVLAICLSALLRGATSSSLITTATNPNGSHSDLDALLAFKGELGDPTGVLARSWTTNLSFYRRLGVSCSRRHRQRVTALSLSDVPLQGELSPYLGN
jgi:hypothetical protein